MTLTTLRLGPESTGRWLVETHCGSHHVLDLDARTYVRKGRSAKRGPVPNGRPFALCEVEQWPQVNSQFRARVADPDDPQSETLIDSSYVLRIAAAGKEGLPRLRKLNITEAICQTPPVNAWLLMGDNLAFPTADELAEQWRHREQDLPPWTAPAQTMRGDLMLLYFMAPKKAVHYIARAVCAAFFDATIEVNGDGVDPHQWWTYLTPLVEIPPVPYTTLRELHGGHLNLRGKPRHYLRPDTIDGLIESIGDLNEAQRLVLQTPTGLPDQPNPQTMTLREWRDLSNGPLGLEQQVEQYIVEPLLRMCFSSASSVSWCRQITIPGAGVADYGIHVDGRLSGVVEVKVAIRDPRSASSPGPDLEQTLRYAHEAKTPAMLIDSNQVLLIDRGAREPRKRIDRRTATEADLHAIRRHFTDA